MPKALISVYDKTGLVDLSKGLLDLGWDLLATGGTLRTLQEAGHAVTEVAAYTGAPECFDGRVKTLHPKIHGGLLHRRDLEAHRADAERLGIPAIDLVVVNLYPFEATIAKAGAGFEDCIEQIDIGGPSMIRSAAKNHHAVTVLTSPDQYPAFLARLQAGAWNEADRRRCALEAFRTTAAYDAAISTWLGQQVAEPGPAALPARITLGLKEKQSLRYGENPHQKAAFHVQAGRAETGLAACRQLQGKELSYNNFLDADSAGRLVQHLPAPGCVIVKHNNPCGVAQGSHALEAFHRALASDPVSAFGGIVAFNRPVGAEVAREMAPTFWEVILAPSFTAEACEILAAKKQLRLLEAPEHWPAGADGLDIRSIGGGFLVQECDEAFAPVEQWQVKASGKSPEPHRQDLFLAQLVAKTVKSNAIVLARDNATVGIGAGQMSRIDSVDIACRKAGDRARGAVLGSDAFFPFADSIEYAAARGVTAFVEPGGSLRDAEVIAAAQKLGVWLFFSGMRHFRH